MGSSYSLTHPVLSRRPWVHQFHGCVCGLSRGVPSRGPELGVEVRGHVRHCGSQWCFQKPWVWLEATTRVHATNGTGGSMVPLGFLNSSAGHSRISCTRSELARCSFLVSELGCCLGIERSSVYSSPEARETYYTRTLRKQFTEHRATVRKCDQKNGIAVHAWKSEGSCTKPRPQKDCGSSTYPPGTEHN